MAVDLFSFVGLFDQHLVTAAHLLDRGEAHVRATGGDPETMLDRRLIDDMHPLRFQLRAVCNVSRSWLARAAGVEPPAEISDALDLAGFRAAIADARAFLATLTPEQLEGRDDTPLTVQLTDSLTPTLPAGQWVSSFAATNILFHLSMVYALLRANGVAIGKADLFAGGL